MKRLYSVSRLLVAFLSVCVATKGFSQATTPLNFTAIPYSNPDFSRPGGGIEDWHGWNTVDVPVEGTSTQREDNYYRLNWNHFESAQGQYTWTFFDNLIKACINKKQKFSFGIMTVYVGSQGSDHIINYDGGYSAYPQYLHNLMQRESVKDWKSTGTGPTTGNGCWIPNWNSESYLSRLYALHEAINNHIETTSYNGVRFRDVINYIDVRGYGNWGEWHSAYIVNSVSQYPAGTNATAATMRRIIDAHTQTFRNFPLCMLFSAYDANRLGNTMIPPDVSLYALTARNNWGLIGWRRDNWGAQDTYIRWYTDQNTTVVNGVRLDTAIMNRWKYAPVTGEPNNGGTEYGGNCQMWDLENQIRRYHASSFGNGNMNGDQASSMPACWKNNVRAASKAAGYRILLEGGSMNTAITTGSPFAITLNWKNVGITPEYYTNWNTNFELRNSSGTAVWTGTSRFQARMFLPQTNASPVTDNFTVPTSVPAGTYTLHLVIRDASGYKNPLPLAIQGRNSDGSYTLRTVVVSTGSATTNQPPVANAGQDRSITLPIALATLDASGSNDPDGTITSYRWEQVGGPSNSIISLLSAISPTVTGLLTGTYTYRLTVTDDDGATATDLVNVNVLLGGPANQAPVANAGANINIQLPVNTATLNGTGSTDSDGTISTYGWQQVSGPSTAAFSSTTVASPVVRNLLAGTYVFRLTVRDNDGATATDDVSVIVGAAANQAPNAAAGANRTITLPTNTTSLNGSASSDPDGTIAAYRWTQVNGPNTATLSANTSAQTNVGGLIAGVYNFRLRVTDNDGAEDSDTVTVTVNAAAAPANQAPVASAGADRAITLPTNSVAVNGSGSSDPDGTIAAYLWSQISGPNTATINTTSSVSPTVGGMIAGTYLFRLRVTDNDGATDADTVRVVVTAAANQAPVANAGADRSIGLPTNSTVVSGAASSDPDGTIAAYLWSQISGPNTATINATTSVSPTVGGMIAGTYYFRLRVTDNSGATDADTVRVLVAPAPVPNQAPSANAGPDRGITLPTNSSVLAGNGSSDPDGTIAAYLWSQISGPNTATINTTASISPTVGGLIAGTYYFRLRVTDNDGATDADTVRVTVTPAAVPNQAPIANAGTDRTITLPTNSAQLVGSGSTDRDGTIAQYLWIQLSGPNTATMSSPTTVSPVMGGLIRGTYAFRLRVADNSGATASDTVRIIVNPAAAAPNRAPNAAAGPDRTITLPNNSLTLNGSGSSDPDGTITAYLWSQISGPNMATISSTASATPTMGSMIAGTYFFRLRVTDNSGATDADTLRVIVNPAVTPGNQAPIADAGPNQVVNLNNNAAVTMNGSNSYDPDGQIVSHQWHQFAGPNTATLSATNAPSLTASNLVPGDYAFVLTVRDNRNATATDTVRLFVSRNSRGGNGFIYPNPATSVINISINTHNPSRMKFIVYDTRGRIVLPVLVKEIPAGTSVTTMDISRLVSGFYLVEVSSWSGKKMIYRFQKL